jgi:mono/diheme cytochrome c family protein
VRHRAKPHRATAGVVVAIAVAIGAAVWVGRQPGARPAKAPAAPSAAPPATQPAHAPRALRDVVFERTLERRERGRYLVNGLLQCFACHSERDWTKPGAPPVEGKVGAGTVWWDRPWLVAPNLTPDEETGTGAWTDDMLARAIREGISHDGRVLHPQMWYRSFRSLADEDLASVIVYLRSLAPIHNPLPTTRIPAERAAELEAPEPLLAPVPLPDLADPVARARYYVRLADCAGCHTSWYTPRNPGFFGGGNPIERPGGATWSANITVDPSGIPYYDAVLFREVMRSGRVKARELSGAMPWVVFRNLSDDDLDAIFALFHDHVPPVRHALNNLDPPTACPICGGTHPLGDRNRPPEYHPAPLTSSSSSELAGRYRFEDGFTIVLSVEDGKLIGRFGDDGPPREVITEDGHWFRAPGEPDVMEFQRAGGRVTGLVSGGFDVAVREP